MAIELDPRFDGAHTDLARSLEALGRFDEARAEYEEGRRLAGGVAGPSFGLAHLEAAAGNEAGGAAHPRASSPRRARTRVVSAWGIAALHASLGDVDEAFRWLDIAVTEKATGLILLRVHPRLDPIRSDARVLASRAQGRAGGRLSRAVLRMSEPDCAEGERGQDSQFVRSDPLAAVSESAAPHAGNRTGDGP